MLINAVRRVLPCVPPHSSARSDARIRAQLPPEFSSRCQPCSCAQPPGGLMGLQLRGQGSDDRSQSRSRRLAPAPRSRPGPASRRPGGPPAEEERVAHACEATHKATCPRPHQRGSQRSTCESCEPSQKPPPHRGGCRRGEHRERRRVLSHRSLPGAGQGRLRPSRLFAVLFHAANGVSTAAPRGCNSSTPRTPSGAPSGAPLKSMSPAAALPAHSAHPTLWVVLIPRASATPRCSGPGRPSALRAGARRRRRRRGRQPWVQPASEGGQFGAAGLRCRARRGQAGCRRPPAVSRSRRRRRRVRGAWPRPRPARPQRSPIKNDEQP